MNLGVLGVGHLGSLHAKMLAGMDGVNLAGVFDLDTGKAQQIAGQYKTASFVRLDDFLTAVDAATIATTTRTHFEVAKIAIEHGKHLFIEKPITETVAQADELCRLAARRGVIIQVGHIERFNPAILALDKYRLNPLFVESHRLAQFNPRGTDVAVVLDLMIHDIDLILSFVRSPVKHVDASGIAVVSDSIDIANARLQFENGCVANVTASRISQKKMRKMRLFQPDEYISIDFSDGVSEVFRLVGIDAPRERGMRVVAEIGTGARRRKVVYERPRVKEVNALMYELQLFVQAIRDRSQPIVSGEDGKRALEVASVIMEKIGQQTIPPR
jgi:predicted dehydrogenase